MTVVVPTLSGTSYVLRRKLLLAFVYILLLTAHVSVCVCCLLPFLIPARPAALLFDIGEHLITSLLPFQSSQS